MPRFILLFALTLSLNSVCFSELTPSINDIMNLEDQKKTGVMYLKQQQKQALAQWFVEHGYAKHLHPSEKEKPVYLEKLIQNGRMLTLSNNTAWEVNPVDWDISLTWQDGDTILIQSSQEPHYPFALENLNKKQKITAKKLK